MAGDWIVKAALEDASLGLDDGCVVRGAACASRARRDCAARFGGGWFAERYVEGREFNIAVLDGQRAADGGNALRALAATAKPRIVGYDAKWEEDSTGWRGTVRAFGVEEDEPGLAAKLRSACEQVWKLFGLTGFARVDFRVDGRRRAADPGDQHQSLHLARCRLRRGGGGGGHELRRH